MVPLTMHISSCCMSKGKLQAWHTVDGLATLLFSRKGLPAHAWLRRRGRGRSCENIIKQAAGATLHDLEIAIDGDLRTLQEDNGALFVVRVCCYAAERTGDFLAESLLCRKMALYKHMTMKRQQQLHWCLVGAAYAFCPGAKTALLCSLHTCLCAQTSSKRCRRCSSR